MPDRWFVVPLASDPDGNGVYPKYGYQSGITGFSGNTMDFSADKWSDLPWYPDTMYVVRFYADTTSTLDGINGNDDAWSENDVSDSEIESYLNDRFDRSLTLSEWKARFAVGV